jgi:putative transposase
MIGYHLRGVGKKMTKYSSKNHSKFILRYHIIFVCKYRKYILDKMGDEVKEIMLGISSKYDFNIMEMEVDGDHIHMMIDTEPKLSPLQIVRVLKQQSTFLIWQDNNEFLRKLFWKEKTFWTDGYFVSTIGEVSSETLKHYIQNQG